MGPAGLEPATYRLRVRSRVCACLRLIADWLSDAESPTCSELPFAARYRVVVVHLDGPARSLALQSRTLPHAGVWCVVAGSPRAGGNRVPLAGARWCFACR